MDETERDLVGLDAGRAVLQEGFRRVPLAVVGQTGRGEASTL